MLIRSEVRFFRKRPLRPQQCAIDLNPQLPAIGLLNFDIADRHEPCDQILAEHNQNITAQHQQQRCGLRQFTDESEHRQMIARRRAAQLNASHAKHGNQQQNGGALQQTADHHA